MIDDRDDVLRQTLQTRAAAADTRAPGLGDVTSRMTRRRRRRAGLALTVMSVGVVGGLGLAVRARDDHGTLDAAAAQLLRPAPTTLPVAAPPATIHLPAPDQPTLPRDPANGPQPTKVQYLVQPGDTIESIGAFFGLDPAMVRVQTGGTITPGQVISLLIGPSSGPGSGRTVPATLFPTAPSSASPVTIAP